MGYDICQAEDRILEAASLAVDGIAEHGDGFDKGAVSYLYRTMLAYAPLLERDQRALLRKLRMALCMDHKSSSSTNLVKRVVKEVQESFSVGD